jgi:hypothetical protein
MTGRKSPLFDPPTSSGEDNLQDPQPTSDPGAAFLHRPWCLSRLGCLCFRPNRTAALRFHAQAPSHIRSRRSIAPNGFTRQIPVGYERANGTCFQQPTKFAGFVVDRHSQCYERFRGRAANVPLGGRGAVGPRAHPHPEGGHRVHQLCRGMADRASPVTV